MQNILKKTIAEVLRNFADKIESDSCELDTEDALNVLSSIAHIKINKQEVANLLGVSTKTVERKEANGEIPPSRNCPCTKKNWWLDEIIERPNLYEKPLVWWSSDTRIKYDDRGTYPVEI